MLEQEVIYTIYVAFFAMMCYLWVQPSQEERLFILNREKYKLCDDSEKWLCSNCKNEYIVLRNNAKNSILRNNSSDIEERLLELEQFVNQYQIRNVWINRPCNC